MTISSDQVLADLRVLDFGNFITAPYAAMLLAEMGADVIKVERPGSGDPFRSFNGGLYSSHFQAHNRNKRSVAVDLNSPAAVPIVDALVKQADVLLLNMRPGAEERAGLAFERVHALNSRLVYCSITGFGATGPYAQRPAYDNVGQAVSGWLSMFHQGSDARVAGPAVSDAITGLFAALGILSALHDRDRTGTGRKVEVSMLEAMIAFSTEPLSKFFADGKTSGFFSRAAASQAFVVTCLDGLRIGLHLSSPPKFWDGLVKAVNLPELKQKYPERMDRVRGYDQLAKDLAHAFGRFPRDHWLPLLEANEVPFAAENRLDDLPDHPQVRHLDVFYSVEHDSEGTVRAAHRPIRFDGDHRSDFRPPPTLGEHTQEVLSALGFSQVELERFREEGLVA